MLLTVDHGWTCEATALNHGAGAALTRLCQGLAGHAAPTPVRRKRPSVVSCPGCQHLCSGGEQAVKAGTLGTWEGAMGAHYLTVCSPTSSLSTQYGVFITSMN